MSENYIREVSFEVTRDLQGENVNIMDVWGDKYHVPVLLVETLIARNRKEIDHLADICDIPIPEKIDGVLTDGHRGYALLGIKMVLPELRSYRKV